ncbi:serine/threonine protein kinase [Helicocarpus griseus UAMH5409]|uniref:EKC/KEOPS complex subunit BUD32 n=1 Tax=Helicocarpus griseus UAMH5409 TaxID=1447875 RepID=A0A2B7WY03_9EURO|nr:serine/threonine protein kinase [Helicocarpus griseus UAMH5409]
MTSLPSNPVPTSETSPKPTNKVTTLPICSFQKTPLIGMGSYADVVQIAKDRVLKRPKIYPENDPDLAYSNFMNREEMRNEKAVYERLGSHEGIIHCYKALDDSIELAYANQGDLEKYMQKNPSPPQETKENWIRSLVDTFSYVHSCRVVHQDIALRNILLHNNSPKLCDFGESSILPLDADMERFCDCDTTPQVEMLYLGYVLYSILVWKELKYDYFENMCFPKPEELPETDGIVYGAIIRKCWAGEYASMEALRNDVHNFAGHQGPRVIGASLKWPSLLLLALLGSFPYVIVHWSGVYD